MPSLRPRSDKQLVAAAAHWSQEVRHHYNSTEQDLVDACERIARLPLRMLTVPTVEAVRALEAKDCHLLPRWVRTARYAVEYEACPELRRREWLNRRTWYRSDYDAEAKDWFDCSYPLLFRDEFYLIEDLQQLYENEVRALRTFLSEFHGPYKTKAQAARDLLRKLGVDAVLVDEPAPSGTDTEKQAQQKIGAGL